MRCACDFSLHSRSLTQGKSSVSLKLMLKIYFLCLQPKGGLDFAAELAAKIGVAPPQRQDSEDEDDEGKPANGEWSDEEHQIPQTAVDQEKERSESKRSRGDSKTKEKKSHHHHHHHHKKDRSESHGEHKHRKRRGSKTSHSSVDTRQSVPAEDGENCP